MQIRFIIRFPTHPSWMVEIRKLVPAAEMRTDIIDGIFRGKLSLLIEPVGEDRSRMTYEAAVIPNSAFMRFAWDLIGRRIHNQKIDMFLIQFKQIVEADWEAQEGLGA